MAIQSNLAFNSKAFAKSGAKAKAYKGMPDITSIAGNTSGIPVRRVQSVMQSIDNSIISANTDGLREAVRRSAGIPDTLNSIEPVPTVRNASAKAFAENT